MELKTSLTRIKILDPAESLDIDQVKSIIKSENENDIHVYTALHMKGRMSRAKLMKETGIARTTLYDALVRLMHKGLVYMYSEALVLWASEVSL